MDNTEICIKKAIKRNVTDSVVTFARGNAIMEPQKEGGCIMTFGEKLKKLRNDNKLTQEELAEKIYVTRTAISKWETDKGYPSIDSLKQLSNLFEVSIDELISDSDIENKRLLEKKRSRKFYWCAMVCLIVTTVFALVSYLTQIQYFYLGTILSMIGYIVFGLLSKPNYKRMARRRTLIIPLIVSRMILAAVIIVIILSAFIGA